MSTQRRLVGFARLRPHNRNIKMYEYDSKGSQKSETPIIVKTGK